MARKWAVGCEDLAGNIHFSANRTLTVDFYLLVDCQELTNPNTIYELQNNVSSNGTCFHIDNPNGLISNITLQCNGYSITYAETSPGDGFNCSVWSPRSNIGVENCNFIKRNESVNNSNGIEIASVVGMTFTNNNFTISGNSSSGIYIHEANILPSSAYNFNITNTRITTNSTNGYGINIYEATANGTIDHTNINMSGTGSGAGIRFSGTYTNVSDLNITGVGSMHGLLFWNVDTGYNYVNGCNISLDSSGSGDGVLFYGGAVGNTIDNCNIYVKNSSDNYAVKYTGGGLNSITNNKFRNSVLYTGNNGNDFYISVDGGGVNNYTNVTWNTGNRAWFYRADQLENFYYKSFEDVYVNDTMGIPVENANVTIKDSSGNVIFNGLTNASGYISRQEISYQKVNHTESPWQENVYNYSNYNFSGFKTGRGTDEKIENVTISRTIFLTLAPKNTNVTDCMDITESGNYNLTNDIINTTDDVCILITASDVNFNGLGHTIDGIDGCSR